jgi:hypothetical protein
MCIVLLSPTIGNPGVFDLTRSPAPIPRQHIVVPHSNKHFKTVLFSFSGVYSCVVVEAPLQPQCRREGFLVFVIFSENSTDLTSF